MRTEHGWVGVMTGPPVAGPFPWQILLDVGVSWNFTLKCVLNSASFLPFQQPFGFWCVLCPRVLPSQLSLSEPKCISRQSPKIDFSIPD